MADANRPDAEKSPFTGAKCPICRSPTELAYRPFCSRRCSDIDLSRWLNGAYAIAGGGADADEDGDETAAEAPPSKPSLDQ